MSLEQTLDAIKRKAKKEGKEEVAKRLIAMGMDSTDIAKATDFPLEKIEQLQKQVH
ncbi:MAG: hypothetical protein K0R57_2210 [Paenibacillaceae bacterium]|nr:hypothetical protein [Paenibacillaceae bacterium]